MSRLSVRDLLAATGGELLAGSGDMVFCGESTDSRSIGAGELFIPIVGEKFDAHDFIPMAMGKGAAGCICSRAPESFEDGKFYVKVENTLFALKALASRYREKFTLPMVQITGSTGKTTAKEMLWGTLSERYNTLKTEANFNSDIGVPLTLLRLGDEHEAAVIETGMDHFGEIRYLGEMVRPQYAAIVNVGVVHMEFLGSRENICKAKCEIFENLAPDGVAFLNGDDDMLVRVELPRRIVRFGRGDNCTVRVVSEESFGLAGYRCTVETAKGRYELTIPSPGEHMVYPASLCVAIGEELGLTREEIERGVANYRSVGARMRVVELGGERVLLEDCYNANPQSMSAALRVLRSADGTKRIAVLGNMGELGDAADEAHADMGRLTGELGIDTLFAVGPRAHFMTEAAKSAGMSDVHEYLTKEEAYEAIAEAYREGAVLLLKASHFTGRFEEIAAYLKESFGTKEK